MSANSSAASSARPSMVEELFNTDIAKGGYPAPRYSVVFKQGLAVTEENDDNERHERPYSLACKLAAEFVGVLIFVFVGSLQAQSPGANMVNAAFAHGITIFVIVAGLGHISGGHFNPAITLCITLCGKLKPLVAVFYAIAQLCGGFVGALLVRAVTTKEKYDLINGGATTTGDEYFWYQGFIAEIMVTFFLTQTVMLTAVDTSSNVLAPLAIGFTLTLDIFACGAVSGASMNPARSFGPAAASSIIGIKRGTHYVWRHHYVYWAGPALGACITALLFRTFFRRSSRRLVA